MNHGKDNVSHIIVAYKTSDFIFHEINKNIVNAIIMTKKNATTFENTIFIKWRFDSI